MRNSFFLGYGQLIGDALCGVGMFSANHNDQVAFSNSTSGLFSPIPHEMLLDGGIEYFEVCIRMLGLSDK